MLVGGRACDQPSAPGAGDTAERKTQRKVSDVFRITPIRSATLAAVAALLAVAAPAGAEFGDTPGLSGGDMKFAPNDPSANHLKPFFQPEVGDEVLALALQEATQMESRK